MGEYLDCYQYFGMLFIVSRKVSFDTLSNSCQLSATWNYGEISPPTIDEIKLMHSYIPSSLSSCETHLRVFWRFWYSDNWSSPSLPSPVMPGEEVSILSRPCSKVPPCSTCSITNLPSLVSWISQTGLAGSTLPASYIIFILQHLLFLASMMTRLTNS